MKSFAAHALSEVEADSLGDGLLVLTGPVPAVPLDRFAAVFARAGLLLWDPDGQDTDGWTFAGVGEALRIEARGSDRLASVRTAASSAFSRLIERRAEGLSHAPSLRLFGGTSFSAQEPDGPWSGFGQASFVLPRWLYGRRGDSAFLRVALTADEVRRPQAALAEIAALVDIAHAGPTAPASESLGRSRLEELDEERWTIRITSALAHIRAGRFEKVVAARRSVLTSERNIDVAALLARMGRVYPDTARFAVARGGGVFIGATPERLVSRVGADVRCDALAGSRARRDASDDAGARSLLASAKDRREHAPVVAGICAALGPFCDVIQADAVPRVRTLKTVHHLWTPVQARLSGPTHVLDLVSALHPTPAVSGLPRTPAMEWIHANEPEGRGWYAAPVGWFDAEGDGTFLVAIRSALVRGHEAWLYAGGGIVEGSDPAAEYQETALKQGTMLSVLGASP
jgi:menaquinone-specific isochorismate synthase